MAESQAPPFDWNALSGDEQTELRIAFGRYLDTLRATCSMETKVARFRDWLLACGIDDQGLQPADDAPAGQVTSP